MIKAHYKLKFPNTIKWTKRKTSLNSNISKCGIKIKNIKVRNFSNSSNISSVIISIVIILQRKNWKKQLKMIIYRCLREAISITTIKMFTLTMTSLFVIINLSRRVLQAMMTLTKTIISKPMTFLLTVTVIVKIVLTIKKLTNKTNMDPIFHRDFLDDLKYIFSY